MSYYSPADAAIDARLKHLNQLVYEGFLSPRDAAAEARRLDPTIYVCPRCGQLQATCDCTFEFPIALLEAENGKTLGIPNR